ncbi:hypothetical protein GCM10010361_37850 [Streptomyces olivaceiscleroticus]|uniref:Uncharacterized protein n=1 Tax=Streptomyces olivaceiscleroticus TaxID=68245 RepID=A0ABN1A892_9ACTN
MRSSKRAPALRAAAADSRTDPPRLPELRAPPTQYARPPPGPSTSVDLSLRPVARRPVPPTGRPLTCPSALSSVDLSIDPSPVDRTGTVTLRIPSDRHRDGCVSVTPHQ